MTQLAEPWTTAKRAGSTEPAAPDERQMATAPYDQDATPRASPAGRRRVLILASLYEMPYRVVVCAAACGAEVYVLGDAGARGLRLSRYCHKFSQSDYVISGVYDEALALEINCLVRDFGIDMVIPADAPSTRALIACRELIEIPCFPLPTLDVFDRLNDKWAFVQLCDNLGIRHPQSALFAEIESLAEEIARETMQLPIMAKPLSMSGSHGCLRIDHNNVERASAINYRPIMVQEFIPGEDIGASVFVRSGEVVAFIAHRFTGRAYLTFHHEGIYGDIARLAKHLGLDGVYNFDMRLTEDGAVHFLECNPRFFFKMNMSMVAGINFVECGFPDRAGDVPNILPDGTNVLMPNALVRAPWKLFATTAREWRMTSHFYSDVLPRLLERVGLLP